MVRKVTSNRTICSDTSSEISKMISYNTLYTDKEVKLNTRPDTHNSRHKNLLKSTPEKYNINMKDSNDSW